MSSILLLTLYSSFLLFRLSNVPFILQRYPSNAVGLGLYTTGGIVTPNQHCRSENMIGGSGILSLKVVRDGPTRVIRVIDIR